jgi:6-pyruvoyltetrahydropterin/6-carboxytetrahydropterin synthase
MLLPTGHPLIRVTAGETEVETIFTPDGRRWIFPRGDCRLLPVANTTAELLAAYIGRELKLALESRSGLEEPHLRVELDECDGQLAIWETRPR